MDIPSIKSLHNIKRSKEETKEAIYDIVLGKCTEKILETTKRTNMSQIFFEVPSVIIGHPNYIQKDCAKYIKKKLLDKGYKIKNIEYVLYIDWSDSNNGHKSSSSNIDLQFQPNLQIKSPKKLKEKTQDLLKKYPHTSKVVFVYKDTPKKKK
jgi:hypothetical protein